MTRHIHLMAALTIAAAIFHLPAQVTAQQRPNVLLLLSDDHSYPFLSCYGDTNVRTPIIDGLAARGMRFHRFFTAAPQCVPSRAALMTGRSPVAARMTRFSSALPRDEITFPEALREHGGYYTGVCGRSFHLDGSNRVPPELNAIMEQHHLRTFRDRMDSVRSGPDSQVSEQVAEFLDGRTEDRPFFLWVNFSDPHHVWNAPDSFRPDPAELVLPAHWPDLPGVRQQVADYCAEVNRLDTTIGAVLDELKQRSLLETTVIVFAGDNGAALPHGKGSLYDPGSNVPLVVVWPGVAKAGTESHALLSGEDLGPTLLEIAGLTPLARMTGFSFTSILKGEQPSVRQYVHVERGPHGSAPVRFGASSAPYDLSRAVRDERYKLIYNCTPWIPYGPVDSAGGPAWKQMAAAFESGTLPEQLAATYFSGPRPVYEFYDLESDPSELTNLSGTPSVRDAEHRLRVALAEKMILDFDYLPLPDTNP